MKQNYGIELVADIVNCDPDTFTKENLEKFFRELCDLIEMKRHGDPMFWHDDSEIPHLKGISGVQFIETSNVVIHCCSLLKTVFINIFSCKEFDPEVAKKFTQDFFKGEALNSNTIQREYK